MAKIQFITAMTMDGFLPKADESLMPNYPLLDLLAERHSNKNKSDIYIAEISDTMSIELLRGLSRYNLIDEMVVYLLPIVFGNGTPVFDDLTPSHWNVHKTTTFPNGIIRIIYHNSCILQ
ncbi:MAG: dihydrofolate reductase family protein [Alistipes sp.]|nr:dihydrofolate reductase family protein [Alistipes sp.]